MTKKDFYYPSSDGKTQIHAVRWDPDGEPKAIVQIIHGMIEFIDRYDDFAKYLAGHGFLVTGEDHLGHGASVISDEYHGFFGKDGNKGIALDGMGLKVVTIGEDGVTEDDILVHDAHCENVGIHMMLADMKYPDFPVALGVIRNVQDVTYDEGVRRQVEDVKAKSKIQCVDDLLRSGSTWEGK
jgi:hypothetical protein